MESLEQAGEPLFLELEKRDSCLTFCPQASCINLQSRFPSSPCFRIFKTSPFCSVFLCIFMLLSVEGFGKVLSKVENFRLHHHRHESEALSASLEVFQSDVSGFLNRLLSNSDSRCEIFTFPWMQQWLEAISIIHKSFANLVANIDYPVSKWESASRDRFFGYTLTLMEIFNSISSTLSHLDQARISLAHALFLADASPSSTMIERLKPIKSIDFNHSFMEEEYGEEGTISDKESVIFQALGFMRGIGLLVCGILLSGLHGDSKPYLQMRKLAGELSIPWVKSLDASFLELIRETGSDLKEVKQVNYAVSSVVEAIANGEKKHEEAEEMQRRLQALEKGMDDFRKEVDSIFFKIMEERDQLLEALRHQKQ